MTDPEHVTIPFVTQHEMLVERLGCVPCCRFTLVGIAVTLNHPFGEGGGAVGAPKFKP